VIFITAGDFVPLDEPKESLLEMIKQAELLKEKALVHQAGIKQSRASYTALLK
jgi:hypothetical protein